MRYCLLLLLLLQASLPAAADTRVVFDEQSPQLLRAVGKLSVPGHRFIDGEKQAHQQDCSASLIGPRTILTAWHCLEYYRDYSYELVFTMPNVPGQPPVIAHRLDTGKGMDADWALLRLLRPIRGVTPIPVDSGTAPAPSSSLLLAGFAADAGLGANGDKLTWQDGCQLDRLGARDWGTNCVTYTGASGGPVLSTGRIVGVISAGDREAHTYFTPSNRFISAVRLHLR